MSVKNGLLKNGDVVAIFCKLQNFRNKIDIVNKNEI